MENSNNSFIKIALVGRMGSGKDTVGAMINDIYDIPTVALAEPIRDIVKNYFPHIYNSDKGARRGAMQHIGESFRQLDPEVWIKETLGLAGMYELDGETGVCITDCRLQVELHRLKEEGFYIVYVDADLATRTNRLIARGDGTTTLDQLMHSTETGVQYYECHTLIDNDSGTTLDELKAQVKQIVTQAIQFTNANKGGEF